MEQYRDQRELEWDDEISNDSGEHVILPEGDYYFTVVRFDRARHAGSEKVPPCKKAVLTLSVASDLGRGQVQTNLFLLSSWEWKLCQFFTAIGQRKKGEAKAMNWNAVPGASGWCKIGVRKWTGRDGREHAGNEVTTYYDPAGFTPPVQGASPQAEPAPGASGTAENAQTRVDLPAPSSHPWSNGRF